MPNFSPRGQMVRTLSNNLTHARTHAFTQTAGYLLQILSYVEKAQHDWNPLKYSEIFFSKLKALVEYIAHTLVSSANASCSVPSSSPTKTDKTVMKKHIEMIRISDQSSRRHSGPQPHAHIHPEVHERARD